MTTPLLQLTDVSKRFESLEGGQPLHLLKGISLEIGQGETVAIVGPSGSGKSTLLNILGTLDQPTGGKVLLEGRDLSALDEAELARVRNRAIGFIFQSHHLLPQCSVLENVLIPTLAGQGEGADGGAEGRARELLGRVGLESRLEHRPGQLSGGECQRVAVVRALINRPRLLLADEPTGALDRVSAESLATLLVDLNREQSVTLIVVTHATDLAGRMARKLELEDGRIVPSQAGI